ncbi:serine--tRNA ligase [Spiroplasma endosymbiont of Aspidapion aeneum]|uniref:serine--tRNA ligase n=1 Tax=Spiroplasma endosymbiont of Aspidapion aeneum TaxID=3066276 RepID=UPI00313E6479
MHNINKIYEDKDKFLQKLNKRGVDYTNEINLIEKDNIKRKKLILKIEKVKAKKNELSRIIPKYIKNGKEDEIENIKKQINLLNNSIEKEDKHLNKLITDINKKLSYFPNIVDDSTPNGNDENDNIEVYRWEGDGYKKNNFDHSEIAIKFGLIDFKKGVKLSGSRFVLYTNKGSKLVRVITDLLLEQNSIAGYEEQWMPLVVNKEMMYGTSNLPKFEDDAFKTIDNQYLIPTSEVVLTNLKKDEIINITELPIKYTGFSQCFRKEAGSAGRDTKGIIRLHQFNKVELVKITHPNESFNELESMVSDVKKILKLFKIPFRLLSLCSGDLGFASTKTYDFEIWMANQQKFREISSCSNCLDFQARRINLKFRDDDNKLKLAHSLNGSCLAIDRLIAAIIEYYYDGVNLVIPDILRKYFNNDKYF